MKVQEFYKSRQFMFFIDTILLKHKIKDAKMFNYE